MLARTVTSATFDKTKHTKAKFAKATSAKTKCGNAKCTEVKRTKAKLSKATLCYSNTISGLNCIKAKFTNLQICKFYYI